MANGILRSEIEQLKLEMQFIFDRFIQKLDEKNSIGLNSSKPLLNSCLEYTNSEPSVMNRSYSEDSKLECPLFSGGNITGLEGSKCNGDLEIEEYFEVKQLAKTSNEMVDVEGKALQGQHQLKLQMGILDVSLACYFPRTEDDFASTEDADLVENFHGFRQTILVERPPEVFIGFRPGSLVIDKEINASSDILYLFDKTPERVAGVISLHQFLDSFLQFRSRDHSARAAPSPRPIDRAAILQGQKLLDLLRLSDICTKYSHENDYLSKLLVANALATQPTTHDNLTRVLPHFLGITHTMNECDSKSLEVLLSSGDHGDHGFDRLHSDFLENTRWIFMDEKQFQYLSGILVHSLKGSAKEQSSITPIFSRVASNKVQIYEDAAINESKIRQVKGLCPDYGKMFLATCLEIYNHNPEEVIQRILEGTLHEALHALDTSLETMLVPKSISAVSGNDKGIGKLIETADSLLEKRDAIMNELEEKKELLLSEKNKMASETALETKPADAVDAYMFGLSYQLVLSRTAQLEKAFYTVAKPQWLSNVEIEENKEFEVGFAHKGFAYGSSVNVSKLATWKSIESLAYQFTKTWINGCFVILR